MSMSVAQRVARRYLAKIAGRTPQGLIHMIHALVKAAGGVPFLAKGMGPWGLDKWDKAEFYRGTGDEQLLSYIVRNYPQAALDKFLEKLAEKHLPAYDGAGIEPGAGFEEEVGGLRLDFTAYGPTFHRYGSDDDIEGYHYEEDIPMSEMVEHSDHGDISMDLYELGKALGGNLNFGSPRQRDSEYGGYYDYYEYQCWTEIKGVVAEDLLRRSVGKLIIQAGESIDWKGDDDYDEPDKPFVLNVRDELIIERRRGSWPRELKKGARLVVLRSGREGQKIRAVLKGTKEPLFFSVNVDRRGKMRLYPPNERDTYLQVRPI